MDEKVCVNCGQAIVFAQLWGLKNGKPYHQVCPPCRSESDQTRSSESPGPLAASAGEGSRSIWEVMSVVDFGGPRLYGRMRSLPRDRHGSTRQTEGIQSVG